MKKAEKIIKKRLDDEDGLTYRGAIPTWQKVIAVGILTLFTVFFAYVLWTM